MSSLLELKHLPLSLPLDLSRTRTHLDINQDTTWVHTTNTENYISCLFIDSHQHPPHQFHSSNPKPLSSSSSTHSIPNHFLLLSKSNCRRMCLGATERFPSPTLHYSFRRNQQSKRSKVQIHRLSRRKRRSEGKEMEEKNMKLYMENMSILKENDKLREKATLLHQENLALMSQFQKKFSHSNHPLSTTLHFSTPPQTLPSIKCSTTT